MTGLFTSRTRDDFAGRTIRDAGMLPVAIEQYRTLALTLDRLPSTGAGRVLVVTSALPGEGKTLTCANLAMALSTSYRRRVLVVDGDLRRPSLHKAFDSPQGGEGVRRGRPVGSGVAVDLTVEQLDRNLAILAPTQLPLADPVHSLASPDMQDLIACARKEFDWVLIDSPPAALVPDANLLAQSADGVIFVIWTAATPFEAVRRGIAAIGKDRILGVVMNQAPQNMADGSFRYYDTYYQSYPRLAPDERGAP